MKQFLFFCFLLNLSILTDAQVEKGKVIIDSIYSTNLENTFGEDPTRAVAVYLPPGYDQNNLHYPVIYFLHGFMGDHRMLSTMTGLLDFAISTSRIRPFIMVIPNEKTTYDFTAIIEDEHSQ